MKLSQLLAVVAVAGKGNFSEMKELLKALEHLLPKQFYTHLSNNFVEVFAKNYQIDPHDLIEQVRVVKFALVLSA